MVNIANDTTTKPSWTTIRKFVDATTMGNIFDAETTTPPPKTIGNKADATATTPPRGKTINSIFDATDTDTPSQTPTPNITNTILLRTTKPKTTDTSILRKPESTTMIFQTNPIHQTTQPADTTTTSYKTNLSIDTTRTTFPENSPTTGTGTGRSTSPSTMTTINRKSTYSNASLFGAPNIAERTHASLTAINVLIGFVVVLAVAILCLVIGFTLLWRKYKRLVNQDWDRSMTHPIYEKGISNC